jgi:hypothetical protein
LALLGLTRIIEEEIERSLIPHLESITVEAEELRPDRMDDWTDSVDRLIELISVNLDKEFVVAQSIGVEIGQSTSKWNDDEWQKTLRPPGVRRQYFPT